VWTRKGRDFILATWNHASPFRKISRFPIESPTEYFRVEPEFRKAKLAAERALELNPAEGTAIVNLAEILDNEYDFKGAEEKIKLALKVDPDNQYVLRNAGRFYTLLGKGDESILYCRRALENDPNNRAALHYLTIAYFYAHRFKEAWTTFKKFYELEYTSGNLQRLYYQLLLEEGNFDRIIKEPSFKGDDQGHAIALAAANFALGNKIAGEKLCDSLKTENYPAFWIAFIYAYGNDSSKVFEWLEKSYILRERELTLVGVEPAFKRLRNDQRMKDLLQKMNLPV